MSFRRFRDQLRQAGAALPETLILYERVVSTNSTARRLIEQLPVDVSPVPRAFVLAHEQSRGRGRLGRHWVSPPGGGLYASLLEPLSEARDAALLPLAVGVALCQALHEHGATDCRLKWPNDLVSPAGKLGGILIEVVGAPGGRGATAIVGFGLNIGALEEARVGLGATSVESAAAPASAAAALLTTIAENLRRRTFESIPAADLAASYRELLLHSPGDQLSWRQGDAAVEGRFAGVDDCGRLLLDTPEGRRVLAVGDIIEA